MPKSTNVTLDINVFDDNGNVQVDDNGNVQVYDEAEMTTMQAGDIVNHAVQLILTRRQRDKDAEEAVLRELEDALFVAGVID